MEEYISLQRQHNMLSTEIGWRLFKQMVQKHFCYSDKNKKDNYFKSFWTFCASSGRRKH